MVICKGSIRCYWNYLEDYRPCAGGFSAVNIIGTHFARPDKVGTDPMVYDGIN